MNEKQTLMIPAAEAAAYLGITPSTLRRETRARHIRAKMIGTRYFYHRGELERYAQDGIMAVPENVIYLERAAHEHS